MDLTITIASYNSKDVTQETLRSVLEHTKDLSFEIIVVDNASKDGSADMIEREFPIVNLIQSPRNLGFAAAHNLAIQQAKGQYILVLNSDVKFLDNAAKRMLESIQSWPKAGALGPKVLNPDGSYAPSASYRQFPPRLLLGIAILNKVFTFVHYLPLDWFRDQFGFLLGRIHGKFLRPTIAERVEWVDGMSVLFSRAALAETGLFDEQFFFDMEIGDLLYRIREKGWEIIYDPGIAINHLGGYSRKLNHKVFRQSIRSIFLYYAKYRPDYIPFMRALFSNALWLKEQFIKFKGGSQDEVLLYCQIRRDVKAFRKSDAYANQEIPKLPQVRSF